MSDDKDKVQKKSYKVGIKHWDQKAHEVEAVSEENAVEMVMEDYLQSFVGIKDVIGTEVEAVVVYDEVIRFFIVGVEISLDVEPA